MSDDKIVTLHPPKKAMATVTHAVPSECPDAPHVRLDGLRRPTGKPTTLPADLAPSEALEALGLGRGIPHEPRSTRVGIATLRELRQRLDSALVTAAETEQAILQAASLMERAARMNVLVRTEIDTLSRRIAEMGGDEGLRPAGDIARELAESMKRSDDDPPGAA